MAKSKRCLAVDNLVASELGLTLSPFTLTLKHVMSLPAIVEGFVFLFESDSMLHYDTMDCWKETLSLRQKVYRFISQPCINKRLQNRTYKRWYVRSEDTLFAVQTAKYAELLDSFYVVTDSDPRYHTHSVVDLEAPFMRKKPLVQCRIQNPGWGVRLKLRPTLRVVSA